MQKGLPQKRNLGKNTPKYLLTGWLKSLPVSAGVVSPIFVHNFLESFIGGGVPEDHIVEMAFELFDNMEFGEPKPFFSWITERISDDRKYYILLDKVQML